jgi:peroxiredoxin Q/BCP
MTEQKLAPGDEAPDFTLPDADGNPVSLSSLRGRRVIVYFYPAAMTPGCTRQACDFRDSLAGLSGAGVAVLGISPDEPAKLAKFRDKEGLTFPLLSDPGHAVHRQYGAYGEKTMYGKKTTGVIRSTFVIGPDGNVEHAYYGVRAAGHVARLRKDLGVLGEPPRAVRRRPVVACVTSRSRRTGHPGETPLGPGCACGHMAPQGKGSRARPERPARRDRLQQNCGRGETGIRGRFRSCWWQHRGGSSPPARTR